MRCWQIRFLMPAARPGLRLPPAGDTLGAIVGPLLALLMLRLLGGRETPETTYRQIFWLTLIPGLLAALAFATLVKEQRRTGNGKIHLVPRNRTAPYVLPTIPPRGRDIRIR